MKNKIIITVLVVTAMLTSLMSMPMTAMAADSVIAYEFNMTANAPSTSADNAPVAYNVSWDESVATTYHNRMREDSVWKHWFDVNYNTIGTADDFTAFCMEYTNEAKVPGLSKDFSVYAASGYAIFDVSLESTVDINNLYFAIATLSNGTTAYAGVPVANYLSNDNRSAVVAIPFSEFEFIGGKTSAAEAIDLSKFSGMGIIRKQATNAQSSGKVKFAKMAVAKVDTPTDLVATTAKNQNILSFTMSAGINVENIVIERISENNNKKTIITTLANWTVLGNVYSWIDENVEIGNGYTYRVKVQESTYGLESDYSNSSYVVVEKDYVGNDIPEEGMATEVVNFTNRNYKWPLPDGVTWYPVNRHFDRSTYTNNNEPASNVGMGAGYVTSYTMNYNQRANEETNKANFWFPDDWYFAGWGHSESSKGGVSGYDRNSQNIAPHAATASVYYQIYIDEGVDLENLYFTIANMWAGGNDYWTNYIGLPATDFVSEDDKGKVLDIVIPLSKFTLDYPGMKQEQEAATWAAYSQPEGVAEIDWTHFWAIGFMRDDSVTGRESTGKIYCSEMIISDVKPVTDIKVHDIDGNKIVLTWQHSESAVEKYNIYRKDLETGEYTLIGESATDMFVDDQCFATNATYEYKVEAVDKWGVSSAGVEISTRKDSIDCPKDFSVKATYSDSSTIEIAILWSPAKYGDVQKYVLYRNGEAYKTFDADITGFIDTDVEETAEYEYYIVATNADGNIVSVETMHIPVIAVAVPAPTNVKSSAVNKKDIFIEWDTVEFADKYIVYLNDEKVGETADTNFTIENVSYDTAHIVSVVSQNAGGGVSNKAFADELLIESPDAKIGEAEYLSLYDAYMAANDGDTITLLSDASGKGLYIEKNIIIDLNGFTYTLIDATSDRWGDKTNIGFLMYGNKNIIVRNGKIKAVTDKIGTLIETNSNLTLEDVTLDGTGTKNILYELAVGGGVTVIDGETNIISPKGTMAILVYSSCADVIIFTTGKIEGVIAAVQQKVLSISNGTYTSPIYKEWCAVGYEPIVNVDGTYGVKGKTLILTAEKAVVKGATGVVMFASYDENGKLIEANYAAASENVPVNVSLDGAKTLKAMLWESLASIAPICNAEAITLN